MQKSETIFSLFSEIVGGGSCKTLNSLKMPPWSTIVEPILCKSHIIVQ